NEKDIERYATEGLVLSEKLKFYHGVGQAACNLGYVQHMQHNLPKALEFYRMSLEALEKGSDKETMAYTLNNMGVVYSDMGNVPEAIDYYLRSLKIREEIGDKKG